MIESTLHMGRLLVAICLLLMAITGTLGQFSDKCIVDTCNGQPMDCITTPAINSLPIQAALIMEGNCDLFADEMKSLGIYDQRASCTRAVCTSSAVLCFRQEVASPSGVYCNPTDFLTVPSTTFPRTVVNSEVCIASVLQADSCKDTPGWFPYVSVLRDACCKLCICITWPYYFSASQLNIVP